MPKHIERNFFRFDYRRTQPYAERVRFTGNGIFNGNFNGNEHIFRLPDFFAVQPVFRQRVYTLKIKIRPAFLLMCDKEVIEV